MSSNYYNMLDSTGASGFLPTVTFDGSNGVFTATHRINKLNNIGITGFYEADFTNTVTVIDLSAFAFDSKIVVATINNVTSIRSDAFYGCTALRSITLDTAVNASTKRYLLTDISSGAFQGCTSLRNLHIPDTVKIVPDNMCNGCSSLEVAVMGYGCDRTGDTYNTTGRIGSSAFANCSRLSYFVVPETVGGISDSAFANDVSLAFVYILGRPDISANAFTSARGTGAIYYYDNSASYTTLTAVTSSALFPTASTKRPYREFTLTATGELSPATVRSTIPATTYWKGKIANSVTSLATSCFAGAGSGADIKYPYMVGLSLPPGLLTIGYGAFINTDGTSGYSSIIGAFYVPNSVTTLLTINNTSNTFAGLNDALRDSSTTRQIVFQSGPNTIAFPAVTCKASPAMAIILPNVTSFGASCFDGANKVQLYSFFQKNAYTATTRLDDVTADNGKNAFTWNFNKGVAGYTHYLYIPKQITRMAEELFRGLRDKIYVTAYHNTISTAGVTEAASGLGFGYFSYNATDGTAGSRFTGAAPTIHLIYNYYDAAGLTLTTSSGIGTGFPYHVLYPSGVKTITNRFAGLTNLSTVTISDTVTDISGSAFSACTGLTRLNISPSSNLTNIGASAFLNCTALTTIFIPNSLRGINDSTFSGCTNLVSVTYGNNPGIKYIGAKAFYETTKTMTNISIPSSVIFIAHQVFITSGSLRNILDTVTFRAGSRLRSIGGQCFGSGIGNIAANYLHDLVLPNNVRSIGPTQGTAPTSQVLRNTHGLIHSANLVFPSSLDYISESILYTNTSSLDISNIYLPLSITNVAGPRKHSGYTTNGFGLNEFGPSGSKSGSRIYLPSHLSGYTGTGGTAFPDANRARSYYRTASFNTNPLTTLSLGASVANTTNITTTSQIHADIKEGVIVIGGGTSIAGTGNSPLNLISVNIPSTVTDICANAFSGCSGLAYVTFSENSHLTTIGNSAFLGCSTIHDIQLPDTLTTIGANAFNGCINLGSISIPYNVTSIGAGAFARSIVTTKLGQDIDGEAAADRSGFSVSMNSNGTIVAIGAIFNTASGGHVRVYKYNGMTWTQLGIDINGEAASDRFGESVSLSSDGLTLAVGALTNDGPIANSDRGHVRVFKYNGTAWTQIGADIDAEATGDKSGTSVSLGSDGTIVAIGAPYNGGTTGVPGEFYGHVRVYKYNGTTWQKLGQDIDGEGLNDQSGFSVSMNSNGNIVAVGSQNNDGTTGTAADNRGHVRVYQYNDISNLWTQLGSDIDGEDAGDNFGTSVSLSSDGNILAIGSINNDAGGLNAGQVRVYKYQTITDATWTNYTVNSFTYTGTSPTNKPIVVNGGDALPVSGKFYWVQLGGDIEGEAAGDLFGRPVSLSADGTIVAIGAYSNDGTTGTSTDNRGHVRIYQYDSSKTTNITDQSSTNFGPIGWRRLFSDIDGEAAGDWSGWSVSLSKDGTTVAIGAFFNDGTTGTSTDNRGHVRVYQLSTPCSVRLHQKLYNDISGALTTYFPGIATTSFQVIPALQLTNTLNPAKLTISQINNLYIRYRQSQLGDCTFITVSASSGGTLTASDIANALSGTAGLVHLEIDNNVTSIGAYACENNTRIYSVAIPKTVITILRDAFVNCTNLTYLSFHPDSVFTSIGQGAFLGTNIIDIALPDSLTSISAWSFQNSYRLTSICIPKSVNDLSANAFYNCPRLTAVALPSSLALATFGTSSYFNTNGASAAGITFSSYSTSGAIPHFKLSDYSLPIGIVQNVVDSAVTYIDHRAYAYYPDITLYAVTTNKQTLTGGPYTYPANNVQTPIMPATFLLNGGTVTSNSIFPIYRSVPDLNVFTWSNTNTVWPENQDDFYILMPGYSISIYNNLYDEENLFTDSPTYRYYDNEFGTVPLNINVSGVTNTTNSILVLHAGRILTKYFLN